MTEQTLSFEAEVARLLDIVANALYSNREIFLRELISNASDACDRLRYEALTQPELVGRDSDFHVTLAFDAKARSLTISDNGIGMGREDLVGNLGTIARSGTAAYVDAIKGKEESADLTQIGQFGVGFYSAFMVAESVEVFSRRAGDSVGWRWSSDGKGSFTVAESEEAPARGTRIVLHLKKDAKEFVEADRLRNIVRTYSDHIAIPIRLETEANGEAAETLNQASALWTGRSRRSPTSSTRSSTTTSATASTSPGCACTSRPKVCWNTAACSTSPRASPSTSTIPSAGIA